MHYNRNANPLLISGIAAQLAVALLPVPLASPLPSTDPERFASFCNLLGRRIPLHEDDVLRVKKFMRRHRTDAVTSDGSVAFTLLGNVLVECDPVGHGQPPERLFVAFQPQEWVQEGVTNHGAPEPVDATSVVLHMDGVQVAQLRDGSPAAAALVDPEARGHYGPYTVACEAALCAFLDVPGVEHINQDRLDRKRAALLVQAAAMPLTTPDEDRAGVWAVPVGDHGAHYFCDASGRSNALMQCRTTFPDQAVGVAVCVV